MENFLSEIIEEELLHYNKKKKLTEGELKDKFFSIFKSDEKMLDYAKEIKNEFDSRKSFYSEYDKKIAEKEISRRLTNIISNVFVKAINKAFDSKDADTIEKEFNRLKADYISNLNSVDIKISEPVEQKKEPVQLTTVEPVIPAEEPTNVPEEIPTPEKEPEIEPETKKDEEPKTDEIKTKAEKDNELEKTSIIDKLADKPTPDFTEEDDEDESEEDLNTSEKINTDKKIEIKKQVDDIEEKAAEVVTAKEPEVNKTEKPVIKQKETSQEGKKSIVDFLNDMSSLNKKEKTDDQVKISSEIFEKYKNKVKETLKNKGINTGERAGKDDLYTQIEELSLDSDEKKALKRLVLAHTGELKMSSKTLSQKNMSDIDKSLITLGENMPDLSKISTEIEKLPSEEELISLFKKGKKEKIISEPTPADNNDNVDKPESTLPKPATNTETKVPDKTNPTFSTDELPSKKENTQKKEKQISHEKAIEELTNAGIF